MIIENQGGELVIKCDPRQIAKIISNCVLLTLLLLNQKDCGNKKTAELEEEYASYQDILSQASKMAQ